MSERITVTGGAVQGSILGVMDHNAVLEDIDSKIRGSASIQKYVDDATLLEGIAKHQPRVINHDTRTQLLQAKNGK